jgi:hypothetical protein
VGSGPAAEFLRTTGYRGSSATSLSTFRRAACCALVRKTGCVRFADWRFGGPLPGEEAEMRMRGEAGWLLAACLVLLGGCDTSVRMARQQAEQAALLPPELAAAAREASVTGVSSQDRAARVTTLAAPGADSRPTGSVTVQADASLEQQRAKQPPPAKQRKARKAQPRDTSATPQKKQAASRPG